MFSNLKRVIDKFFDWTERSLIERFLSSSKIVICTHEGTEVAVSKDSFLSEIVIQMSAQLRKNKKS